jgi:periplasmic divalent cation tolerance protein
MTLSDQVCEVVITADSEEWLLNFTRSLVTERLAACGQHMTPIRSIYRWNNEVQQDNETRVALHTRVDLVPAILERVRREHSYEVPCVIALPITTGNPDYLNWVIAETEGPE